MKKETEICERLSIVETKISDTRADVKLIKNNELPHIRNEVNKINTNFKVYKAKTAIWAGIGIFVATFLAQIIIKWIVV